MSTDKLVELVDRLEQAVVRLEKIKVGGSGPVGAHAVEADVARFVVEYDNILNNQVAAYVKVSSELGSDIAAHAQLVNEVFQAQRAFLVVVSKHNTPSKEEFGKLLAVQSEKVAKVVELREKSRKSEFPHHLSAVAEGIGAVSWVAVEPTPGPHVKEMADAAMFYTNRVMKDFKEKDPKHVEWAKSFLAIFQELQVYIKAHHTTGCSWNKKGSPATIAALHRGPPTCAAAPAAPPPPPPPVSAVSTVSAGPVGMSSLLGDLNKGANITSGLKKVSDDQKVHKNPALRSSGIVQEKEKTQAPTKQPAAATAAPKKDPVLFLDGKKWSVEYHQGNKQIVIDQTEISHSVYAYQCVDCLITVKGKVNSITLDSCKKTAIVFDDLVSMCELINCQRMQAQAKGKMPTLSIQKTDGCQVYLSKDSVNVEIVSSKVSEINILTPKEDGQFDEHPLAEQFTTVFNGTKLVTTPNEVAAIRG